MLPDVYLAAYGTLRKGQGFYNGLNNPKFIRTTRLHGFVMWSLGGCPIVTEGEADQTIVVDILKLGEKDARTVSRVEWGAGYLPMFTSEERVKGNDLLVWVSKDPAMILKRHLPLIESGDWVEYVNNRKISFGGSA